MEENKGEFPVYSSQTANNGEIGKISSFDFDGEYITWTTDGANAGTVFYRQGKFSITNVCGLVDIQNDKLLIKFVYYYLTITTKKYVSSGMGNPKLMSNVMAKIKVPIPPLEIQQEIVQILDKFTEYVTELTAELTAELTLRQKQYNYFRDYLLTAKSNRSAKETLSQNSALSYFNKVKFVLKQAYKDGILQIDLNAKVKPIKEAETRREFLTIEELNKLVKTECTNPLLKKIALFSALTGMAFKEIQNLKWRDIKFIEGEGYLVLSKRQKTQRDNYLPISEQAFSLCGNHPGNPNENVFLGLKYSAYNNKQLTEWIEAAGIAKNITFHCFRHTFATLQLYSGTDIYTVSKMLGHKDLKTTQIYAKIVDEAKRTAANKIKLDNL